MLNGVGFCRRYPPPLKQKEWDPEVLKSWESQGEWQWIQALDTGPMTANDYWCGEFKSR